MPEPIPDFVVLLVLGFAVLCVFLAAAAGDQREVDNGPQE